MARKKQQQAQNKAARKRERSRKRKRGMCGQDQPILEPNAAGIDVGAREMYVAVPPDRDRDPVRVFGTFTDDLDRLVNWLLECGITTVAMESTGVYWIPVYEMLADHGLRPCLVNARHMKNVPGRRTDWHDCQWLQYLHSVGLLRPAFRPEQAVCVVRAILRHRSELVQMAAQHVQHMQKALTQMNLQIQHVISDITGFTGLAIVDAILAGERNPEQLASLRDPRIKADQETIRKSLVGDWRHEHLFTLRLSRQMFEHYQQQILACEKEMQKQLGEFSWRVNPDEKPLPPDTKHKRNRRNRLSKKRAGDFHFDLRTEMYKLFGVDVTRIPGLDALALQLFSEVGRDLSRFPTAAQFSSWCGLCPDNDVSGGTVWKGGRRINHRVGHIFRLAAHSLHHNLTPLGDYLRRMKAKAGPKAATTATAHKIAIIFYKLVKNQVEYDETIWSARDAARQKRFEEKVKRQARKLGFELVPAQPAA
jgi:transposase